MPLSIIFILFNPPSLTSTIIFDAPASHEFSINSFTTLKGFSTTSPAAILEATSGDSLFITGPFQNELKCRNAMSYINTKFFHFLQ